MIFEFIIELSDLFLSLWLPREWGKMCNRHLGLGGENPSGTYLFVAGLIAQLITFVVLAAVGLLLWILLG